MPRKFLAIRYMQCARYSKIHCLCCNLWLLIHIYLEERLAGTSTTFDCHQLTGSLNFTRRYGDVETLLSSGGRFSISGQTLTISDIQPEDEGEYTCSNGQSSGDIGCLIVSGECHVRYGTAVIVHSHLTAC